MNLPQKINSGIPEIIPAIGESEDLFVFLTRPELGKLLSPENVKNPKHMALMLTCLYTGARISEILNIKKNHLDLMNKRLKIITKKQKGGRNYYRHIRIHDKLNRLLSLYSAPFKPSDRLFTYSRTYCYAIIRKYSLKAGLGYKKVGCHTFRHTFAVHWLEDNHSIVKLKRHLGHASISSTLQYLKIVDTDYYKDVDAFDPLEVPQ